MIPRAFHIFLLLAASTLMLRPMPAHTDTTPPSLSPSRWVVTEIGGQPVLADTKVTLNFTEKNGVGGNAGVNSYNGQCLITPPHLAIDRLRTTRMAGPQPHMEQEQRYLQALGSATSYEMADGTLVLKDASGAILISATAAHD